MAQDQHDSASLDSVSLELEEILAELDLLPEDTAPVSIRVEALPTPPAPLTPPASPTPPAAAAEAPKEPAAAEEPVKKAEETAPPQTVSGQAKPAQTVSAQTQSAAAPKTLPAAGEDRLVREAPQVRSDEPVTVVFRPDDIKRMRLTTDPPPAALVRHPARPSASLKEELEQLARTDGSHSLTEALRAKDGTAAPAGKKPARRPRPEKAAGSQQTSQAEKKKAAPVSQPEKKASETASEPAAEAEQINWKHELLEWGKALAVAFVVVFVLFFVVLRIVRVDGGSMEPTLTAGDRLIISGIFYSPENGDIVVTTDKNGLNKPLVKRVIAVGGQTVDLDKNGGVLVNGLPLDEEYLDGAVTDPGDLQFPLTVPEGSVLLMGDNRSHSTDSRSSQVGMLSEKEIQGKVLLRFFPFNKFGGVD